MTDHELQHLIQMANQIAANFSFHSDPVQKVADHMQRFWAPSMRRLLSGHASDGGAGLESVALEAVRRLPAT